jgi:hypothetical protein
MKSNAFNGLGGTEAYSVYGMVYGTSGLVDPKPMELAVGSGHIHESERKSSAKPWVCQ